MVSQELDSVILRDPFQLGVLYDSIRHLLEQEISLMSKVVMTDKYL